MTDHSRRKLLEGKTRAAKDEIMHISKITSSAAKKFFGISSSKTKALSAYTLGAGTIAVSSLIVSALTVGSLKEKIDDNIIAVYAAAQNNPETVALSDIFADTESNFGEAGLAIAAFMIATAATSHFLKAAQNSFLDDRAQYVAGMVDENLKSQLKPQ